MSTHVIWWIQKTDWPDWVRNYESANQEYKQAFRLAFPGLATFADKLIREEKVGALTDQTPATHTAGDEGGWLSEMMEAARQLRKDVKAYQATAASDGVSSNNSERKNSLPLR
jgi:hypothetical protein